MLSNLFSLLQDTGTFGIAAPLSAFRAIVAGYPKHRTVVRDPATGTHYMIGECGWKPDLISLSKRWLGAVGRDPRHWTTKGDGTDTAPRVNQLDHCLEDQGGTVTRSRSELAEVENRHLGCRTTRDNSPALTPPFLGFLPQPLPSLRYQSCPQIALQADAIVVHSSSQSPNMMPFSCAFASAVFELEVPFARPMQSFQLMASSLQRDH